MPTLVLLIALLLVVSGSGLALWFFVNEAELAAFDPIAWTAFFVLTLLGSGGIFSIFGLLIRRLTGQRLDQDRRRAALRQGFLLGLLLVVVGTLQLNRVLTYLSGGLAVAAVIFFEAFIARRS